MSVLSNVELVMWSPVPATDPPLVGAVRHGLACHGFQEARADAVPFTTAFRRVVKGKEDKETKATVWQNGKLRGQIDRLEPDGSRIKRVFVAGWAADPETESVDPDDIADEVRASTVQYTWADVSQVIQRVLKEDGLGAYSPKKTGGVYFVPTTSRTLLDSLQAACAAFGLNLLRYQIPDTDAQRGEIAAAIADAITAELDTHDEAIQGYSPDTTKPGVVVNRQDALIATDRVIQSLAHHLAGRAQPLRDRLNILTEQAAMLLGACQDYRAPAQSRRIVTNA